MSQYYVKVAFDQKIQAIQFSEIIKDGKLTKLLNDNLFPEDRVDNDPYVGEDYSSKGDFLAEFQSEKNTKEKVNESEGEE